MKAIARVPAQPRHSARPELPAGRAFLTSALAERSAPALIASFRRAVAAEGATRHLCTLRRDNGSVETLACDYPFDPEAVLELSRLHFEIGGARNERLRVTLGGLPAAPDAARRARLHSYAMLYATCLPPLLDAR
jgi:hypothetical protein